MKKSKSVIFVLLAAMMIFFAQYALSGANVQAEERIAASSVNHMLGAGLITIVDETTDLSTPLAEDTNENYYITSRKWSGMSSVICAGNNIFVAWQTGGTTEPDPNNLNYVVVAASTDGGFTWVDPFMIIRPVGTGSSGWYPRFYYNHAGELNLIFSWEGKGVFRTILYNADGPLNSIYYSEPEFLGVTRTPYTKPTLLSDGNIMYGCGSAVTQVMRSADDGATFQETARITSELPDSVARYSECTLVEKKDGTLWVLRRLENAGYGGVEQSFSADGGKTWTTPQYDLPFPLRSPGSMFHMVRLKSGALLFVTNAAGMGMDRRMMTAYLSEDDGESWPYSLLLDTSLTSYPDIYQHDDGTIYVTFDKDRYGEGGVRLCVFTEEDVKTGAFVSEGSKQLVTVVKLNYDYADIRSVNNAFPAVAYYPVGTSLEDILSDLKLPVVVTDDNGVSHELKGRYQISGYDERNAGEYTARFVTDLPATLKDSFNLLQFKIILEKKKFPVWIVGCGIAAVVLAGGSAAILLVKKKKKIVSNDKVEKGGEL